MKKKYIILSLAILALVGSLFVAFASNMFFGDIINISAGMAHTTLFVTLPAVGVALSLMLATLYIIRMYKHPDCVKRISKLYAILLIAFNAVGLLGVILSVAVVYGTLVGNNPFPGYLIIFMLLNLLFLAAGVVGLIFLKKVKDDEGRVKVNFLYGLKTAGWVLFILLVYNRFGTLLVSPSFIYLRNLYMTFPFYIWQLVPMFIGVVQVLYILGIIDNKKAFLMAIIGIAVNVALFAYVAIMGLLNSAFVASLSQSLPLERMAAKPMEVLIHMLANAGVGAAIIVQAKKQKQ